MQRTMQLENYNPRAVLLDARSEIINIDREVATLLAAPTGA